MEVGPILSSMWRNKTGSCLIALQIAVTLAVVVNALFIINQRIEKIQLPVGSDTENIFSLETVFLSDGINVENQMNSDLEKIRNMPGTQGVISILNNLQSGSSRVDTYRGSPELNDDIEIYSNINYTDENGLEALGVKLLEGRFFRKDEIQYISPDDNSIPESVIVTESLGRKYIPEGPIAGQVIYYDERAVPIKIIGVIENIATAWLARDESYLADTKYNFMLQPYMSYQSRANYLIRAEPGQRSRLMASVEAALLEIEPNRLIRNVSCLLYTSPSPRDS